MLKEAFGKQLREQRKRAGLTQEKLSLLSGVTFRYLQDIEMGNKQPTITTVFRLAAVLDVLPGDLLDRIYQEWRQQDGPEMHE